MSGAKLERRVRRRLSLATVFANVIGAFAVFGLLAFFLPFEIDDSTELVIRSAVLGTVYLGATLFLGLYFGRRRGRARLAWVAREEAPSDRDRRYALAQPREHRRRGGHRGRGQRRRRAAARVHRHRRPGQRGGPPVRAREGPRPARARVVGRARGRERGRALPLGAPRRRADAARPERADGRRRARLAVGRGPRPHRVFPDRSRAAAAVDRRSERDGDPPQEERSRRREAGAHAPDRRLHEIVAARLATPQEQDPTPSADCDPDGVKADPLRRLRRERTEPAARAAHGDGGARTVEHGDCGGAVGSAREARGFPRRGGRRSPPQTRGRPRQASGASPGRPRGRPRDERCTRPSRSRSQARPPRARRCRRRHWRRC
jgi:hypothetical protein